MKAIELLQAEIDKLHIYDGNMPEIYKRMVDSIPSNSVPDKMKLALVMSEVMTYCSEFKIPIKHWNGSMIPVNAITFCIAKSGACKDSSQRAIRKCFDDAYKEIDEIRCARAEWMARYMCRKNKKEESERNISEFYVAPNPLFLAISTTEGFIQHLNDMNDINLGSGYIKSGEIGQDLISNANLPELLKTLSELYDTGDKELKAIKDRKLLSKEVKGMPVNALFLGSQDNIIYDKTTKSKFRVEFSTKLARRSTFVFANDPIISKDYNDIEEIIKEEMELDDNAVKARAEVIEYVGKIQSKLKVWLEDKNRALTYREDTRRLYTIYKRYCEEDAEGISIQYPLTKLTRTHLHWKAFKLAGAIALFDEANEEMVVKPEHLLAAIEFEEKVYPDIRAFEDELSKESYESLVSYCKAYSIDNKLILPLYLLKKLGFIEGKIAKDTIPNLIKMVSSYDKEGTYIELQDETGIMYQGMTEPNEIGVSYKVCTGSKAERAKECADGFVYKQVTFERLGGLLKQDLVYTPFEFRNGKRNGQNIVNGTRWVAFDVDDGDFTDEEAHNMLCDVNHHICRTSDSSNPYRYRVLIQMKQYIDLPNECWIRFIELVGEQLMMHFDTLPKSQIFFSYSGDRTVYSVCDQEPLDVSDLLEEARKKKLKPKAYTKAEKSELIGNPMSTFLPAYQATQGEGRRKMVWVVKYGKELGMSKEEIRGVLDSINNYWVMPMGEKDYNNILKFLDKHMEE